MPRRPKHDKHDISLDEETVTVTPVVDTDTRPMRRGESCLVVIYGPDIGRRIPLAHDVYEIGRSSKSDLPLEQESVSRHHARITRTSGDRFVIADLGSTNGTYVNDHAVTEHVLSDGDQVKIGRSILKFMTGDNIETSYHEEIYRLMTVDGLTGLFNKRYFSEALEREVNRAQRYGRPLALLLLDLDHFKAKNDRYGHVAGDALLKQVAGAVRGKLRREDIFARVGGEEFGVLLPELSHDAARTTAEKVRAIVAGTTFTFDALTIPCTVSIGVASLGAATTDTTTLYAAADAALYAAKQGGRDRVEG